MKNDQKQRHFSFLPFSSAMIGLLFLTSALSTAPLFASSQEQDQNPIPQNRITCEIWLRSIGEPEGWRIIDTTYHLHHEIKRLLGIDEVVRANVAASPRGDTFKKLQPVKLTIGENSSWTTLTYRNRADLIPQGSKAFVTLFSGVSTESSHSGAMLESLNYFTSKMNWAGEAIDLPAHGLGPHLFSLDEVMLWLKTYYDTVKAKTNLPIVAFTRSGSGPILMEFNRRYPGYIDRMIVMSPDHPIVEVNEANRRVIELHRAGALKVSPLGYAWINKMDSEVQFHRSANPLGSIPTLILYGAKDPERIDAIVETYRAYIREAKGASRMEVFPDAGHNVFILAKPTAKIAYQMVSDFVLTSPSTHQP